MYSTQSQASGGGFPNQSTQDTYPQFSTVDQTYVAPSQQYGNSRPATFQERMAVEFAAAGAHDGNNNINPGIVGSGTGYTLYASGNTYHPTASASYYPASATPAPLQYSTSNLNSGSYIQQVPTYTQQGSTTFLRSSVPFVTTTTTGPPSSYYPTAAYGSAAPVASMSQPPALVASSSQQYVYPASGVYTTQSNPAAASSIAWPRAGNLILAPGSQVPAQQVAQPRVQPAFATDRAAAQSNEEAYMRDGAPPKRRSYILTRHLPGCFGCCNTSGRCDKPGGACGLFNCNGCCDRERLTYSNPRRRSVGSIEAPKRVMKPRVCC